MVFCAYGYFSAGTDHPDFSLKYKSLNESKWLVRAYLKSGFDGGQYDLYTAFCAGGSGCALRGGAGVFCAPDAI
jgi:hypothetical protein